MLKSPQVLEETIRRVITETPIIDMHTHLYPSSYGPLLLRGIDDLLTYHYLIAETLRYLPGQIKKFWKLSRIEQADLIWRTLFLEHTPVSESCRGVLTVLKKLGLDVASRNLNRYREYFASLTPREHIDTIFQIAGIKYLVMTNDPFNSTENSVWEKGVEIDPRFRTALRLDSFFIDWPKTVTTVQKEGYQAECDFSSLTVSELRRFLDDRIRLMNPMYLAVSLPPTFNYPAGGINDRILDTVILPSCRETGRPLALMIGVKRAVNPDLGLAGDAVGRASVAAIENLCSANPDNRFLVTVLSRENQHELCVAARKFSNLMLFGCWWFLNCPSLIRELTEMRTELLGLSYIPQHSDARVLDQLIYKWDHSREIISQVLFQKYQDLLSTGWAPAVEEIRRDYEQLFVRNFESFCRLM